MTCHKISSNSSLSDRPPHAPEILGRNGRRAVGWIEIAGDRADARDQARLCQPADRAARRLRRSRQLHHRQFQGSDQGRHQDRQRHRAGRGRRQGQPVQSEPRRRGRQGSDRPGQDRPDAGRLDAGDHQPGLDPMRDRGGAVHLDGGAVAALVHRPAGQSRRRAAGMEALQLHLSLLLGARGRHRRLHQHVEPGRDQQIGRRPVSQRRRRQCLGRQGGRLPAGAGEGRLQAHRSRPLPESHRQFLGADQRVQDGQLRDRHRRGAAAGFHDVLEAGAAARLQAEGRLDRQGDPVSGRGRGARQGRPQSFVGSLVVAEPSVQVVAHRQ